MEVKPEFRDPQKVSLSPEWRCPFNRGNKYKGYVNTFRDQILCPLKRGVPKERFHCLLAFFFIVSERLLKGIIFHERIPLFIHLEEDYS